MNKSQTRAASTHIADAAKVRHGAARAGRVPIRAERMLTGLRLDRRHGGNEPWDRDTTGDAEQLASGTGAAYLRAGTGGVKMADQGNGREPAEGAGDVLGGPDHAEHEDELSAPDRTGGEDDLGGPDHAEQIGRAHV